MDVHACLPLACLLASRPVGELTLRLRALSAYEPETLQEAVNAAGRVQDLPTFARED
ncbi:hypothetical protein D779_2682 [Imhoffiella purpurea]|uniref:Uncharacterized protein n=1 Tax=Imhoffiella purpurea TaxID=1249627 RepID=W9VC39_9GAMM|nr:hypothetical protein D779_2682 [Imhoffiella purpurea]